VGHIQVKLELVDLRSRRPEVGRHTGQAMVHRTVPVVVVRRTALEVVVLRTVLEAVVRRTGPVEVAHHIDLEEALRTGLGVVRHTVPVEVVRRIDLEVEALHTDPVEALHTVLAVVARRIALVVEEPHTGPEEDTVDSALAVVDSNLVVEVDRNPEVGVLSDISMQSFSCQVLQCTEACRIFGAYHKEWILTAVVWRLSVTLVIGHASLRGQIWIF
tara:strand:+ start:12397 stop:13044 length:648 start_codon:yes stop_codon:yes gene_type:complete